MDKKRYLRIGCSVLFICSFIVAGALYCLRDGKTLFDIYLPAGQWNDEAVYYKQVESIIRFGMPQGYWGYEESHAEWLTFGPWSVAILLPYALLGKILGWHLYSPILCNLLLVTAALALFLVWARPQAQQMLFFVAALLFSPILVRYTVSGMVEPLFYAFAIAMAAVYFRLEREYSPAVVVFAYLLCSYFTLARPYMIPMLAIPFYYWQKRSRRAAIGCTAVLCLVLAAAYIIIVNNLCSMSGYINTSVFSSFSDGLLPGIKYFLISLLNGLRIIAQLCISAITVGDGSGVIWFYFLLPALSCVVLLVKDPRDKGIWFTLVYGIILFLAAVLFNNPYNGRHPTVLYPFVLLLLSMHVKAPSRVLYGTLLLPLVLLIGFLTRDPYLFDLPYRSPEIVEADRQTAAVFEQVMPLDDTVGWENSVSCMSNVPYTTWYFIPPGFGVVFDFHAPGVDEIKSRYVLALRTSEIAAALAENGCEVLWESDDQILFRR